MNVRDRQYLDLAYQIPCQFKIPGVCEGGDAGEPCHGNGEDYGKGLSLKADDIYHAAGCRSCHRWYDIGRSSREVKSRAFLKAMLSTWREYWSRGLIEVKALSVWLDEMRADYTKAPPASSGWMQTKGPREPRRSGKTGHVNGLSTRSPAKCKIGAI